MSTRRDERRDRQHEGIEGSGDRGAHRIATVGRRLRTRNRSNPTASPLKLLRSALILNACLKPRRDRIAYPNYESLISLAAAFAFDCRSLLRAAL
ncbi:MAG: hypothetical protein ACXVQR_06555 [Solirubrobacteraceae bacterium]